MRATVSLLAHIVVFRILLRGAIYEQFQFSGAVGVIMYYYTARPSLDIVKITRECTSRRHGLFVLQMLYILVHINTV